MIRYAVPAVALMVLSGCASTALWQHPQRAGDGHDGATMALAECQSYAAGRTPMPKLQAYMPVPAPTTYNTTGTITNYGSTSTFQGTTTASGGFATGYANGANMGANFANAYAMGSARKREEQLTAACMRTQGWIDTSSPEGKAQLTQAVATMQTSPGTTRQQEADKAAEEKWVATINAFIETEAARPGGIDYRKDRVKQAALDKYVKELANAPDANQRSMAWYLIEAHKKVLQDDRQ